MDELIKKLMQSGLAELEGLHITGTVPVRQELVNDAIQGFLRDAATPKAAADVADAAQTTAKAAKAASSAPSLPKEVILGMVKRAEVKMHEGQLVVEFEIQR